MTSHILNIARANNSIPVWAPDFTDLGGNMFLNFGEPLSVLVPDGVNIVFFGYGAGAKVFVNPGDSPGVLAPAGEFVNSIGDWNPYARRVKSGDNLWFQTANASNDVVSVSFYDNQERPL